LATRTLSYAKARGGEGAEAISTLPCLLVFLPLLPGGVDASCIAGHTYLA
jgi:hypothetical protein